MKILHFNIKRYAAIIAVIAMSGCTTMDNKEISAAEEIKQKELMLQDKELMLQNKESLLANKESQLQQREASLKESQLLQKGVSLNQGAASKSTVKSSPVPTSKANTELLPPNAKSGECYARLWAEPTYQTITEDVVAKEASERVEIIPAEYEMVTEEIMIAEASSKLIAVPAQYGTESEEIKIRDAQRLWFVDLKKGAAPASQSLLDTAKKHGIDLDAAEPGMCYHEHYRPSQYEYVTEEVLVKQEAVSVGTVPASYKTVEKSILVKEASKKLVTRPAVYETVTEEVIDKPAHTIWKKGQGPIQKINAATGEIMCLVDVPATYKRVSRQVLKSAPYTEEVEIPAVYKTVKINQLVTDSQEVRTVIPAKYKTISHRKKVSEADFLWHEIHNKDEPRETRTGHKLCLKEIPASYKTVTRRVVTVPASFKKVEIPAKYKTVKVRKVVTPASEKRIKIPAKYKTVSRQELVENGHMEWRSILCDTNINPTVIKDLQVALQKSGFEPGSIDGVIGQNTLKAVNAYQRDKGLPVDNYLNLETLKSLGVNPR